MASSSDGIGDVTSDARGSGARFNAGKVPVELIPIDILVADVAARLPDSFARSRGPQEALRVLDCLGSFQVGDVDASHALLAMDADWPVDCARVFEYGARKYAAWNWAKGMAWSVPMACAVRHLLAILRGEELDKESGLPHRGHVACNLVMLAQFERTYPEGDDRPVKYLQPAQLSLDFAV